jgi:RNA polymerase sigma-70 factor (ECF subfamily)
MLLPSNGAGFGEMAYTNLGGNPDLGCLLERYRGYLLILARMQIGRRLQGKVDADDVVQETFLRAVRDRDCFRGSSEKELAGWLRQILAARLAELVRRYCGTQSRDVRLEQTLQLELDHSSQVLDRGLVAQLSSPSQQAARHEQATWLAQALERLPDDYRAVLVLHDLEECDFPEVARRMGRSVEAVKKLWARALARLRKTVAQSSDISQGVGEVAHDPKRKLSSRDDSAGKERR